MLDNQNLYFSHALLPIGYHTPAGPLRHASPRRELLVARISLFSDIKVFSFTVYGLLKLKNATLFWLLAYEVCLSPVINNKEPPLSLQLKYKQGCTLTWKRTRNIADAMIYMTFPVSLVMLSHKGCQTLIGKQVNSRRTSRRRTKRSHVLVVPSSLPNCKDKEKKFS